MIIIIFNFVFFNSSSSVHRRVCPVTLREFSVNIAAQAAGESTKSAVQTAGKQPALYCRGHFCANIYTYLRQKRFGITYSSTYSYDAYIYHWCMYINPSVSPRPVYNHVFRPQRYVGRVQDPPPFFFFPQWIYFFSILMAFFYFSHSMWHQHRGVLHLNVHSSELHV